MLTPQLCAVMLRGRHVRTDEMSATDIPARPAHCHRSRRASADRSQQAPRAKRSRLAGRRCPHDPQETSQLSFPARQHHLGSHARRGRLGRRADAAISASRRDRTDPPTHVHRPDGNFLRRAIRRSASAGAVDVRVSAAWLAGHCTLASLDYSVTECRRLNLYVVACAASPDALLDLYTLPVSRRRMLCRSSRSNSRCPRSR